MQDTPPPTPSSAADRRLFDFTWPLIVLNSNEMRTLTVFTDPLKLGIARIPNSVVLLSRLGHTYLVTNQLQQAYDTMHIGSPNAAKGLQAKELRTQRGAKKL